MDGKEGEGASVFVVTKVTCPVTVNIRCAVAPNGPAGMPCPCDAVARAMTPVAQFETSPKGSRSSCHPPFDTYCTRSSPRPGAKTSAVALRR